MPLNLVYIGNGHTRENKGKGQCSVIIYVTVIDRYI